MRAKTIGVLLAVALMGAACNPTVAVMDAKDRAHRLMREGAQRKSVGDYDGALRVFNEVLDSDSGVVLAHLELGFLYLDHRKDYLRAIYHFERYLESRPATEKKTLVEERLRVAHNYFKAFANEELKAEAEDGRRLREENARLKARIDELQAVNARLVEQLRVAPRAGTGAAAGAQRPAAVSGGPAAGTSGGGAVTQFPLEYVIQRGDSLETLATRFYGDPTLWREIYEANRGVMRSPDHLVAGRKLQIPDVRSGTAR